MYSMYEGPCFRSQKGRAKDHTKDPWSPMAPALNPKP